MSDIEKYYLTFNDILPVDIYFILNKLFQVKSQSEQINSILIKTLNVPNKDMLLILDYNIIMIETYKLIKHLKNNTDISQLKIDKDVFFRDDVSPIFGRGLL